MKITFQESDEQQAAADEQAVFRHAIDGTPVPPDVSQRVRERADRITERIRLTRGIIDDETFQSLLSDDDDA
jgi:hypothetical protein